ncbi:hypothetical protein D3C81_1614310 [compost metagenome]
MRKQTKHELSGIPRSSIAALGHESEQLVAETIPVLFDLKYLGVQIINYAHPLAGLLRPAGLKLSPQIRELPGSTVLEEAC